MISPATARRDRGIKLDRYRHYGVGEYWVVDPEAKTVDVWHLADGDTENLSGTDTLKWAPLHGVSLTIPLSELFTPEP